MPSTRVWLACAIVTAVVVTAVLLLTDRPGADAGGPRAPQPPPPLTEEEVRAYLLLKPKETAVTQEAATEFLATRRPGQVDDPALGEKAQARMEAHVQGQHMTLLAWQGIRDRVERVVNLIRAETDFPAARPDIVKRVELRKDLLKNMGREDARRPLIEREIRDAEALLVNGPPKASDQDRALALRFWESLDRTVPRIGSK